MEDSWEEYWRNHAKSTKGRNPQFQVLRTLNKKPIEDRKFKEILHDIEKKIKISPNDKVLDLCCGNGLITTYLASKCKHIVGVDFTHELVKQIDVKKQTNISIIVEDITKVDFGTGSFDKIIINGSLQYMDHNKVVTLFDSVFRWLRNNGLFFVGDIPDYERIWSFFNSEDREKIYFDSIKDNKPIIGTWFCEDWLEKLGRYSEFSHMRVLPQPSGFPFAHYRFDMVFEK